MLKRLKRILLFDISTGDNAKKVQTQIEEQNRKFAIIWATFQILYWMYCIVMSTIAPDFKKCQNIYIIAFAMCIVALVLAVFAAPKALWLVKPISFALDIALLGAGILIARFLAPKTIVIFVSVIIVPVFFISDTLPTLILLVLNATVFGAIGRNSMETETFQWTMVNLLIFSSVGLILGYFVNKTRIERFCYAESAMQLAESHAKLAESNAKLAELQRNYAYYDQMTGLQNRRAYAEKIDLLAQIMSSGCCVIMIDINGLKELNDTRGHEAGDELIIASAECLRKSFDNTESIYRIGGDEFCVITNDKAERVEECLKQLEKNAGLWKGKYVNGFSVAYGYASDKEFDDFDSMLKAADKRMYEFKSNYYRSSGKDRRRR